MRHDGNAASMLSRRVVVATLISLAAVWLAFTAFRTAEHSDFGSVWYGARALLHGRNPYELIGRGKEFEQWPLLYPAPALVAAIPLVPFSERVATTIFVGLSTFLLALGITRKSWHLLPLFISEAFTSSARLGQWSIIMTAALFFPWISILSVGKPQAAVPILASTTDSRSYKAAIIGAIWLIAVSLLLMPTWPQSWIANVWASRYMDAPITRSGGFLIALALVRWRRPEAWLLVATACMPQSWGWYGTLALFTVPATFAESVLLAGTATIGGALFTLTMPSNASLGDFMSWLDKLILVTIYLPVTIMVLRRPNEGPPIAWLTVFRRRRSTPLSEPMAG